MLTPRHRLLANLFSTKQLFDPILCSLRGEPALALCCRPDCLPTLVHLLKPYALDLYREHMSLPFSSLSLFSLHQYHSSPSLHLSPLLIVESSFKKKETLHTDTKIFSSSNFRLITLCYFLLFYSSLSSI